MQNDRFLRNSFFAHGTINRTRNTEEGKKEENRQVLNPYSIREPNLPVPAFPIGMRLAPPGLTIVEDPDAAVLVPAVFEAPGLTRGVTFDFAVERFAPTGRIAIDVDGILTFLVTATFSFSVVTGTARPLPFSFVVNLLSSSFSFPFTPVMIGFSLNGLGSSNGCKIPRLFTGRALANTGESGSSLSSSS